MNVLAPGVQLADATSYAEAGLSRLFEAMRCIDDADDDAVSVTP